MKKLILKVLIILSFISSLVAITSCGKEEVHTHSYAQLVIAPTCTTQGYTAFVCECGDNFNMLYVDKLGHDFTDFTTIEEPSCHKEGMEERVCKREGCGYKESQEIDKLEHAYTEVVTAPTCLTKGYTTYTCLCGYSYVDNYIAELNHNFSNWTETKSSTCTEKGLKTRVCQRDGCGHKESQELDKLEHSYNEVVTPSTCLTKGYTTYTCACGKSYVGNYTIELSHNLSSWVETKKATCIDSGLQERHCKRQGCSYAETSVINPLGHTYKEYVTNPTCTNEGYTTYLCYCGYKYKDNYTDKLNHTFSEPTYKWDSILSKCTASRVCTINTSHLEMEIAKVEVSDVLLPTTEKEGIRRYSAVFINPAFESQVKEVTLPKLIQPATITACEGGVIEDYTISMVVDKNVDIISFKDILSATEDTNWRLFKDEHGQEEITTKKLVLKNGDNIVYVIATSKDGNVVNVYTVNVYRVFEVDITYYFNNQVLFTEKVDTNSTYDINYTFDLGGYTFVRWKDENNNVYQKHTILKSENIYAEATVNLYKITFDVNGGDKLANNTQIIEYNSNIEFEEPSRKEHVFLGWYDGENLVENGVWTIFKDVTLTAKWQANLYSIEFDSNGGSLVETIEQGYGTQVEKPIPVKKGFVFAGWYETNSFNEYVFDKIENRNVKLTAVWALLYLHDSSQYKTNLQNNYTLQMDYLKDYSATYNLIVEGYVFDNVEYTAKIVDGGEFIRLNSSNESITIKAIKSGVSTIEITACGKIPTTNITKQINMRFYVKTFDSNFQFENNTYNVIVGESLKLNYTYDYHKDYNLTFKSSNEKVLKVDNLGNITTFDVGSATVTAYYGTDSYKDAYTCEINVGFFGILPSVGTSDYLRDGDTINIIYSSNLTLQPIINFNGKIFKDVTFSCNALTNKNVVSIKTTGDSLQLSALNYGSTYLEIVASWKGFTYNNLETLKLIFKVNVLDKVSFVVNDEPIRNITLSTLDTFAGKDFVNSMPFAANLLINNGINKSINVTYKVDNTNVANIVGGVLKGYKEGSTTITVSATYKGKTYTDDFIVKVERATVKWAEEISYFSITEGKMLDLDSGEYLSLPEYLFGKGVAVKDIYVGETKLTYSNGKITGIDDALLATSTIEQTLTIGTNNARYIVDIVAYSGLVRNKEDFVNLLNRKTYTKDLSGYYYLLNNIDFEGDKYTQVTSSYNFIGVLDGGGHIVSNIDLSGESRQNPNIGLFGTIAGYDAPGKLQCSLTVKNIAFNNVYLENGYLFANSHKPYSWPDWNNGNLVYACPSFTNIFVRYSYDTVNPLGLMVHYGEGSKVEMRNIVVDFAEADINESNTHPNEVIKGGYTQGCGVFFSNSYKNRVFYAPWSSTDNSSNADKCSNNYLLSKYPIAYCTENNLFKEDFADNGKKLEGYGARDGGGILYAENASVGFDGKPLTDKLGVDGSHALRYTKCKGIYQFDDASDMAMNNNNSLSSFNYCWTIVDGVPIWKGLEVNNAVVSITSNSKNEKFSIGDTIEVSVTVNEKPINFTLTSSNVNIVKVENNKLVIVSNSYNAVEITIEYKVNNKTYVKIFEVVPSKQTLSVDDIVYISTMDNEINYDIEGEILFINQTFDMFTTVVAKGPNVEKTVDKLSDATRTICQAAGFTHNGSFYSEGVSAGVVIKKLCKIEIITTSKNYVFNNAYVCTKAIDEPEDLKVFEVGEIKEEGASGGWIYGTYELINNIDASNITIEHNVFNKSADSRTATSRTYFYQGFVGSFDGNGYTISNLRTGKYGLFFNISHSTYTNETFLEKKGCATVEEWATKYGENVSSFISNVYYHGYSLNNYKPRISNVAFYNVIAEGPVLAIATRPANRTDGVYVKDIYVKYSKESTDVRGLFNTLSADTMLHNIVIDALEISSYNNVIGGQGLLVAQASTYFGNASSTRYPYNDGIGKAPFIKAVFILSNNNLPIAEYKLKSESKVGKDNYKIYAENNCPKGSGVTFMTPSGILETDDYYNGILVLKGVKQYGSYAQFKNDRTSNINTLYYYKGENKYFINSTYTADGPSLLYGFENCWTIKDDAYPVWKNLNN